MSFRGDRESLNNCSSGSDSDSNPPNFPSHNRSRSRSPIQKLNKNKMATPTLKKEFIEMIPDFYGETELLPRFIEICEKLVNRFYNVADVNDFQNEYLMSSILAKLKGEVAINISSCIINNWNDLKNALVNSYADKRDCYSLNIELTELKQNHSETPFEFYNRIQHVLNLQISYLNTHVTHDNAAILIGYFRNYALRILLRGLKEPLGSLMRTKNPADLNVALNMLTNDFQLETLQRAQHQNYFRPTNPNNRQTQRPKINFNNVRNPNPNNFRQNNPTNTTNQSQRPQVNQRNNNTNSNTSPVNGNQFNNNFNNASRQNSTQYPRPMTISTNNTYRPPVQSNNNNNRRNEQLFNINEETNNETPINDQPSTSDSFLANMASDQLNLN